MLVPSLTKNVLQDHDQWMEEPPPKTKTKLISKEEEYIIGNLHGD